MSVESAYDIVVAGGGTAGCVIASRLSEACSLRILLLEVGPDNSDDPKISTPLRSREMFGDSKYDWDYRTVPQKHADNRVFHQTQGRMLGGSSAINSHSLVYPNHAMHGAWAEIAGDDSWSWAKMQCFYEKFQTVQVAWEKGFEAVDSFHPRSGIDGQAMGGTTNTNAIDARDGKGERSHAGKAYLEAARQRDNLTVVTEARVNKVIIDQAEGVGGKLHATGVLYEKDGQSVLARAEQEVVVCAGVFSSPQLLELPGIGNKDILERAGVQCVLHSPEVGENLQDHLNFGLSSLVQSSIETFGRVVQGSSQS